MSLHHRVLIILFVLTLPQDVFNETRSILEPAGAVAVAGAKAYLQVRLQGKPAGRNAAQCRRRVPRLCEASSEVEIRYLSLLRATFCLPQPPSPAPPAATQHYGLTGQTVVAVTSGANMNFDRLRLVAGEALGRVCNARRVLQTCRAT